MRRGTTKSSSIEREAEILFLSDEEGREILERAAQRYLKMSADQFVHAWESGEFEDPDAPEVQRVAMLLPLAR
jgi:hypothetical protein